MSSSSGPSSTDELFGFGAAGARFAAVEIADRPHPAADALAIARLRRLTRGADVVHAHGLRAGGLAAIALRPRRTGAAARRGAPARRHAAQRGHRGRHDRSGVRHAGADRGTRRHRGPGRLTGPGRPHALARRRARSAGRSCRRPPQRRSEDPAAQAKLRAEPRRRGAAARSPSVARLADQKGLPDAARRLRGLGPPYPRRRSWRSPATARWRARCARGSRPRTSPYGCSAAAPTYPNSSPPPTSPSCRASGKASRSSSRRCCGPDGRWWPPGSVAFPAWSATPRCSYRPATLAALEAAVLPGARRPGAGRTARHLGVCAGRTAADRGRRDRSAHVGLRARDRHRVLTPGAVRSATGLRYSRGAGGEYPFAAVSSPRLELHAARYCRFAPMSAGGRDLRGFRLPPEDAVL